MMVVVHFPPIAIPDAFAGFQCGLGPGHVFAKFNLGKRDFFQDEINVRVLLKLLSAKQGESLNVVRNRMAALLLGSEVPIRHEH